MRVRRKPVVRRHKQEASGVAIRQIFSDRKSREEDRDQGKSADSLRRGGAPSIAQRAAVLSAIGAADQRAALPIDHDGLPPADRPVWGLQFEASRFQGRA
jgi:hypothetical protein